MLGTKDVGTRPNAGARPSRDGGASRVLLAALAVLLIAVLPPAAALRMPGWELDEGRLLTYPARILAGDVPNLDFETPHPPGGSWILAAAYRVFGPRVAVERAVGLLYRLATVLALFMLARRWGLGAALGSGLLAALALAPIPPFAFAWLAATALTVAGLWLLGEASTTPARRKAAAGGLLMGLALLFRLDLALAAAVATVPLLVRAGRGCRARFLAGAALGLLPLGFHALAAGPAAVVSGLFVDPVFRTAAGRALPFPFEPEATRLLWLMVICGVLVAATGGLAVGRRDTGGPVMLALGLFSLALIPEALLRADLIHVLYVAWLPVALAPVAVASWPRWRNPLAVLGLAAGAAAMALVTAAPKGIGAFAADSVVSAVRGRQVFPSFVVEREGRAFPVASAALASDLRKVLRDVDEVARAGDRVFIGPRDLRRTNYGDTFLYFLLPDLEPATYHLEMNPGTGNGPASRLAGDIASADLLILTSRFDGWSEPNASRRAGPRRPVEVVAERFCLHSEHGSYSLLLRCR